MSSIKQVVLQKKEIVSKIVSKINESNGVIFYQFSNVPTEEIFSLKQSLEECHWEVFKNTLFHKALLQQKLDSQLKGNNAFIFCQGDYYSSLRTLRKFDLLNDREGAIQGGLFEGRIVDKETIDGWSKLKPIENYFLELSKYLSMIAEKFQEGSQEQVNSDQVETQDMNSEITTKMNDVIEFLGTLTPPHINKFVDLLRDKYNLDNISSEEVTQSSKKQDTFSLFLNQIGGSKVAIFTSIKEITKKASIIEVMKVFKDASNENPIQIIDGLDKEQAEAHKAKLESQGATITIK